MAYVKLIKERYSSVNDMKQLMDYICNLYKCTHEIYGGYNIIGLNSFNPEIFAKQLLDVQYERNFLRRVYHVIISFDKALEKVDLPLANQIGWAVAGLYSDYQSIFVVHEDSSYIHIHMVFNNCAIYDYKKNLTEYFDCLIIKELVERMIDRHLGVI